MSQKSFPYLKTLVGTYVLPISVSDIKTWIRNSDADDTEVTALIKAQVKWFENTTDWQIFPANYEWFTEDFPRVIPKKPVTSITEIAYRDSVTSDFVVMTENVDYRVVQKSPSSFAIHYLNQLPMLPTTLTNTYVPDAVRIKFVAGFTIVPDDIIEAFKFRISNAYDDRTDSPDKLQRISESLISPYMPPPTT